MGAQLTEIEEAVVRRMLADSATSLREGALESLARFVVEDRHFTGKGFIVSFVHNDETRLFPVDMSMRWGMGVMGRLNGALDVGFVVYVDDGYVDAIEGYTFGGDEWPEAVSEFELFELPDAAD